MSIILTMVCIYWLFKSPKSFITTAFILGCIGFVFTHPILCIVLFLGLCWVIGWSNDISNKNKTNEKTSYQYTNNNQQRTYSNPTYRYFKGCTTKEQLKKRHRELCMKFHPDRGGNAAQFNKMQEEYEMLKKKFN